MRSPWAVALVLFASILISGESYNGVWVAHEDLDLARSDVAVVSYDDNVYVFGGSRLAEEGENPGKALDTLVRYNPKTQEHTSLDKMPEARYRMGYAVLNGKIYVFQGLDAYGGAVGNQSTMIYDIANNNWSTEKTANTEVLRSDMCAASAGGKIYAFGGYRPDFSNSDEIDEFDPTTMTWTQLDAKLQRPRGDCSAVTVGDKIFVLGGTEFNPEGHDSDGVNCTTAQWPASRKCFAFSHAVEMFDPSNYNVTEGTPMKTGRGDFGAAVTPEGSIVVAGGETRDLSSNVFRLLATDTVEMYNMTAGEWMDMARLPEGRFRAGMAAANGMGILVGGVPSCTGNNETVCLVNAKKSVHAFHFDPSTLESQDGSSTASIKLTGVGFTESDYNDKTDAYTEFKNSFEEDLERAVTMECGCQPEATINSVTFNSRKSRRSLLDSHDVTVSATVSNANPSSTSAALADLEGGGSLGGATVTEASSTDDGGDDGGARISHLSACLALLLGVLAAFLA